MTAVLDQVKNVAYTGVGVNLVVTDAIIGRDLERALSTLDTVLSFGVDVAHLAQELVGHFRDLT
ncbi:MAG: hypothetical protein ACPGNP_13280, partial [Acidimicrobiales bacterium]